ncbi:acrosin-like [Macrotis lagotis]|uniref:acrosin-like n=1 Tax=Macrotis lagotis TaxID=92651 RepID=UPI003D695826
MARPEMLWLMVLLSLLGTVGVADVSSCSSLCGQRPLANQFGSRIVGGVDSRPGAWPWIVSIQIVYWNGRYRYHTCGGSLIAPTWVLTAAHCFNKSETEAYDMWRLLIGAWEIELGWIRKALDPQVQERAPIKIILHESYDRKLQKNDIALIQLDRPVVCGDRARIACLPRPGEIPGEFEEKCHIAGWGYKVEGGAPSPILQEAQVNMIDSRTCNGTRWYWGYIHKSNLCAGYEEGKIDTCQGDSGGPLMCKDKSSGAFVVYGVTSWGAGCARAYKPGIYTSTWHFLDWISSKIGPASVFADLPPRITTTIATTTTPTSKSPLYWIWPTFRPWYSAWWMKTTKSPTFKQWWSQTQEPWLAATPLARSPSTPPPYTILRSWISNAMIGKAQALGPSQDLTPLTLSFPKRLRMLMESMKSNNSL